MVISCVKTIAPESEDCILFSEIQAANPQLKYDTPYNYLAEAIRADSSLCYWTLDAANSKIILKSAPVTTSTTSVTTSAELLAALSNAPSGALISGGGGTFTMNPGFTASVSDVTLANMTIQSSSNTTGAFMTTTGSDFRVADTVVFDMQSQDIRRVIQPQGDNFAFHGTIRNVAGTSSSTYSMIYPRANNVYITCAGFENLTSTSAPIRAIHWDGVAVSGGVIANCDFNNIQAKNANTTNPAFIGDDGDAIVVQNLTSPNNEFTAPLYIMGNRGINMGKRFTKMQSGNVYVLSNEGTWQDQTGPLGYRTRRVMFSEQWGGVIQQNNIANSMYSNSNEETAGLKITSNVNTVTPSQMDCNTYNVSSSTFTNPGFDYGIIYNDKSGSPSSYFAGYSMNGNTIQGSGSLRSAYYDGYGAGGSSFAAWVANFDVGTVSVALNSSVIRN